MPRSIRRGSLIGSVSILLVEDSFFLEARLLGDAPIASEEGIGAGNLVGFQGALDALGPVYFRHAIGVFWRRRFSSRDWCSVFCERFFSVFRFALRSLRAA